MKLFRYILALIGIAALAAFLRNLDLGEVSRSILQIRLPFFGLAVLATALNLLAKAHRWRLMIAGSANVKISFGHALAGIVAGIAAASLSPGRALDVGKPLMLKSAYGVSLGVSSTAVIVERVLDLFALGIVFSSSLWLVSRLPAGPGFEFGGAGLVFLAAVTAVMVYPESLCRLAGRIVRGLPGDSAFRKQALRLLEIVTNSLLVWKRRENSWRLLLLSLAAAVLEVVRAYAVLRSVGIPVSIPLAGFSFSASIILGLAALIPGGVGVTETSQAAVLGTFLRGSAGTAAIKGAIALDRILSYYALVLAGALILLAFNRAVDLKPKAGAHENVEEEIR